MTYPQYFILNKLCYFPDRVKSYFTSMCVIRSFTKMLETGQHFLRFFHYQNPIGLYLLYAR